jgi:hypothetical protein
MTEKNWKELIDVGEKLHEEARIKKRPGEMNLKDFMDDSGFSKDKAKAILRHLVEAGLLNARVDGRVTYYSPKK